MGKRKRTRTEAPISSRSAAKERQELERQARSLRGHEVLRMAHVGDSPDEPGLQSIRQRLEYVEGRLARFRTPATA